MFWTRVRREERRQRVLDELLALDPGNRLGRLNAAVAAHEIRPEDVGPALKIVERLDRLREMRVPPGGHLPGWGNLPQSRQAEAPTPPSGPVVAGLGPESGDDLDSDAGEAFSIAIPVAADADPDPVATWLGSVNLPPNALEAVSRLKAGRRVRKGRPGARGAGTVRRRARASIEISQDASPSGADVAVEAGAAADESWPSIAWLRP